MGSISPRVIAVLLVGGVVFVGCEALFGPSDDEDIATFEVVRAVAGPAQSIGGASSDGKRTVVYVELFSDDGLPGEINVEVLTPDGATKIPYTIEPSAGAERGYSLVISTAVPVEGEYEITFDSGDHTTVETWELQDSDGALEMAENIRVESNGAEHTVLWDPVSGAQSYIVTATVNDTSLGTFITEETELGPFGQEPTSAIVRAFSAERDSSGPYLFGSISGDLRASYTTESSL